MSKSSKCVLSVQGLIFDLDGTLADSMEYYYRLACDVTDLAGAPPVTRERLCELMGLGDPDLLRKLLPEDFPEAEATLERIVRERLPAWARASEEIRPLPGCIELLHRLHALDRRLGLATSSGRAAAYLDRWGVRHLFRAVVGREEVTRRKPHPESVLRCLSELGVEPRDAAYVGDSPIDIQAGRAAGVRTVGVLTGTSSRRALAALDPDHILESAIELLDLLGD
jgi:HAD superfamily hydrolase (TIGR01509 family)